MSETGSEIDREQATARAQAVKQTYASQLMAKANVVGVGVGFQTRARPAHRSGRAGGDGQPKAAYRPIGAGGCHPP